MHDEIRVNAVLDRHWPGPDTKGTTMQPPTQHRSVTLAALPEEAWRPVDASSANRLVAHRQLYLRAGRTQGARLPGSEVAAGIVLNALGAMLLALLIRQVRSSARTQSVPDAAGTRGAATHGGGVGRGRGPGRWGP